MLLVSFWLQVKYILVYRIVSSREHGLTSYVTDHLETS